MRALTTLGVAAALALAPTAAVAGTQFTEVAPVSVSGIEITEVAPVSKTSLARTGGATTNGFYSSFRCFFYGVC